MPYVSLNIQPPPSREQAARLAEGITSALAEETGKRRAVTAVRISAEPALLWTINASPTQSTTAFLDVKITAGTNSEPEKAALLTRLHALLESTLGPLAEASYLVIHELPAECWGYAGLSQADRMRAAQTRDAL